MEGTADFASVTAPIVSDGLSISKKRKRIVACSSDPFYVFACLRKYCCDVFLDLGIVDGKQRHKDDSQNREDAGEE